ncbi:MAG: enoyl-CoA hydratase-related protein [Aquisalinus sp.]|nr:enoyl-CoA hydratase-related protein [Aquisalinus sp.]
MENTTVLVDISDRRVARITLNRPDVCNALNDDMINELSAALANINTSPDIRAVIFTGANNCFCAGLDIKWMERMAQTGSDDVSRRLAHLLLQIKDLRVPTVAMIDGPCVGGGVALAVACDISVTSEEAYFALPAVHLGAIPSIVAPFIIDGIGAHLARRYLLTGERFTPERAKEIHLIHAVCMRAQLEPTVGGFIDQLLQGGPAAIEACKDLISYCEDKTLNKKLVEDAARRGAKHRKSSEAREGLSAFLDKRSPSWAGDE